MPETPFVAVGHIANDIYPEPHLGGGVSYSGITASRLGYESHIYTKCRADDSYLDELRATGITVHVLPSQKNITTSFDNRYDSQGNRTQKAGNLQEPISVADLVSMEDVPKGSTILIAPIVGEVDPKIFIRLSETGKLAITPQGYFRNIQPDGEVKQKRWEGFQETLANIDGAITVLSVEDITIDRVEDEKLLKDIVQASSIVALTEGDQGVTVWENGKKLFHTDAFPLSKEESVDFTGAGDVFAAVFITEHARNSGTLKEASVAACLVAALKIRGITGGTGIQSIPTLDDLREYYKNNKQRVDDYVQSEKVSIGDCALWLPR